MSAGFDDMLRRILSSEEDRRLAELAVRRGRLAREQLDRAVADLSQRAADGAPVCGLADLLAERGLLSEDDRRTLRAETLREDVLRAEEPELPAEAAEASRTPGRLLDEFVLVACLGESAAYEVWKAWDRPLRRWVAVKRPVGSFTAARHRDRFRREALAAARLSHPHIVQFYRAVEHSEIPYLVLEYIEGDVLAGRKFAPRDAAALIRDAAAAVDYAHRQGVIHRDLKPANLIRASDGRVRILDFGIAQLDEEGTRLTAEGSPIGTAAYMAPEQARGELGAIGPAADVYGLGATLYELLSGRPPFVGSSFSAVLEQAVREDPLPLHRVDASIDRDLAAVVGKAMEKEPHRRYAGAKDLREDLDRYLGNRAVTARPFAVTSRLLRTARRNVLPVALAGVAAIALTAVGLAWADRARDRRRAVDTLRDTARASLDGALTLRRRGENAGMRHFLPPLDLAYRAASERAPSLAEPDHLMGRMFRALMDDALALQHQEKALQRNPDYGPALYERAVLTSRLYGIERRRAREEARALGGGSGAYEPASPALAIRADALLRDCRALEAGGPEGEARAFAARGLLAYHGGKPEEARPLLERALAIDPGLEEAWEALALAEAETSERAPDLDSKLSAWARSEEAFTRGIDRDRGYLPHRLGLAELRIRRGDAKRDRGLDPLGDYAAAEKEAAEGVRLDDRRGETWLWRGRARLARAIFLRDRPESPEADYAAADVDLTRALEVDPSLVDAWTRRGLLRTNRGSWRMDRKEDATADYAAAEADFGEALRRSPDHAPAWHWRGIARVLWGMGVMQSSGDPRPRLEAGAEDLAKAVRLSPAPAGAHLWQGIEASQHATYLQHRPLGAPDPFYERGERSFAEAQKVRPDYADAFFWRGLMRSGRAGLREREGKLAAARDDLQAALSDLREAVRINPQLQARVAPMVRSHERMLERLRR